VRPPPEMDNKEFKKHLRDLAHGHHHPEEHDWAADASVRKHSAPAKTAGRAAKPRKRSRKS